MITSMKVGVLSLPGVKVAIWHQYVETLQSCTNPPMLRVESRACMNDYIHESRGVITPRGQSSNMASIRGDTAVLH